MYIYESSHTTFYSNLLLDSNILVCRMWYEFINSTSRYLKSRKCFVKSSGKNIILIISSEEFLHFTYRISSRLEQYIKYLDQKFSFISQNCLSESLIEFQGWVVLYFNTIVTSSGGWMNVHNSRSTYII